MPAFRFIDVPTAADVLGTSRAALLAYVDEGRLKPYSGAGQAAVFRTRDVEALREQLGVEAAAPLPEPAFARAAETPSVEEAGRRRTETIRRDPVKKVGTRLTQDVRWGEISDEDLAAWFDALDERSYAIVRHAARQALQRLTRILELTGGAQPTAADRALTASGRVVTARDVLGTRGTAGEEG